MFKFTCLRDLRNQSLDHAWRGIRLALTGVAMALLLVGCGVVQMAYNNADALVYWRLDSFVDIQPEQASGVREALARVHSWHRREELPRYADLLATLRRDALGDTTPTKVCELATDIRQRVAALAEPAEDFLIAVVPRLSPSQMAHLVAQFDKRNREWREDWLDVPSRKQDQRRADRMVDAVERFYGSLTETQGDRLKAFIANTDFPGEQIYAARLHRQSEALAMLATLRETGDQSQKRLVARRWLAVLQESPSEAYRQASERSLRANCGFLAELHNSMDMSQRQRLAENLARYENDARSLSQPR